MSGRTIEVPNLQMAGAFRNEEPSSCPVTAGRQFSLLSDAPKSMTIWVGYQRQIPHDGMCGILPWFPNHICTPCIIYKLQFLNQPLKTLPQKSRFNFEQRVRIPFAPHNRLVPSSLSR